MVALLLLAIWFLVKPGDPARKLDKRVDDAVALTAECRIADARTELAELRGAKASAAQLERLQKAIAATAPACEKKNQRKKAWAEARPALETALASGALERASTRLATFTKRWGDDDETRDWRERIDARRATKLLDDANACLQKKDRACVEAKLDAAEKLRRPEAEPRIKVLRDALSRLLESTLLEQGGQGGQAAYPPPLSATPPRLQTAAIEPDPREARRLQTEAERELAQGNYRSAVGRAAQCAQLGGRDCAALRDRAARLDREFQACLKAGREWIEGRCE
ncbi:hypothetical protein IP92_01712 [Pseudoduganella flava]|nr:hypothetical protein IP92_01712 [Pseudoduganella flava]